MITRAELSGELALRSTAPTKTYVLEVHAAPGPELLNELFGPGNVQETADAYLFAARTEGGRFWIDQIDDRFWSFHTDDLPARQAHRELKRRIDVRRDLDWMWLPTAHLRNLWPGIVTKKVRTSFDGSKFVSPDSAARDLRVQLSGRNAEQLLTLIESAPEYRASVSFDSVQALIDDEDFGRVEEGVNRAGRFAVSGDSLELHLQFVQSIVDRYRRLVTLCEQRALTFAPLGGDGGGMMSGAPIVIDLSRPIPDVEDFLGELLASREPFRLWGAPTFEADCARVEAVDLHMGQRVRLDVGERWLCVYLQPDGCGNTVVRLVSNLQHVLDGALSFRDPELQDALTLGAREGATA